MRIWGLINESKFEARHGRVIDLLPAGSLPTFTRLSDNVDVIALLFRLLTKAAMSVGAEPDESLLDECCLLPNQVLIPQMDLTLKAVGVVSPALFTNTLPLNCTFFHEPSFLKYNIKTHVIEGAVTNNLRRKMDAVRHISLGPLACESSNVRNCSRCTAVSLLHSLFKTQMTRSWDQRWVRNCLCGGNWLTATCVKTAKISNMSAVA